MNRTGSQDARRRAPNPAEVRHPRVLPRPPLPPPVLTPYPIGKHYLTPFSLTFKLTVIRLLVDFVRVCQCSDVASGVGFTGLDGRGRGRSRRARWWWCGRRRRRPPPRIRAPPRRRYWTTPGRKTASDAHSLSDSVTLASTNQKPPFVVSNFQTLSSALSRTFPEVPLGRTMGRGGPRLRAAPRVPDERAPRDASADSPTN